MALIFRIMVMFHIIHHEWMLKSCFFLRFYLFIHKRHRERERQRHRQREKQGPRKESDVGLDPGP